MKKLENRENEVSIERDKNPDRKCVMASFQWTIFEDFAILLTIHQTTDEGDMNNTRNRRETIAVDLLQLECS